MKGLQAQRERAQVATAMAASVSATLVLDVVEALRRHRTKLDPVQCRAEFLQHFFVDSQSETTEALCGDDLAGATLLAEQPLFEDKSEINP